MTAYNELYSILHPVYVALVEFVKGKITVSGGVTEFSFCLTDDQRRYIEVYACPNHRHIQPYTSVTELLFSMFGSGQGLHLVQLQHRYTDMPPLLNLQDLLDKQSNLDEDIRKSLKLDNLALGKGIGRSLVENMQHDLQEKLTHVRIKMEQARSEKRVLKACWNANEDLLPPQDDSPEYERSCKILVNRLHHKGWKIWENSQQQWSLLNQQYKLATHQLSYPEFCLQHVNGLASRREWLQFQSDFSIYDSQMNDYIVIYYMDTFSRLDYSYQKGWEKAAEEWDYFHSKYTEDSPFELKQHE